MIYVRNKSEALDALSAVLALPERRDQIVQLTVRVAMCLDADARSFLADCQAGLIEGGLEDMRRRRHEMLSAMQSDSPEAILIIDSSEDQLLEAVGTGMDALRLAEIARQVFPGIEEAVPIWQIARAILADEAEIRKSLVAAVQARNGADGEAAGRCREEVLKRARAARPPWIDAAATLRSICDEAGADGQVPADAAFLFAVVAVADERARTTLDLLAAGKSEALEYLSEVRRRIDTLRELEAREAS